MSSDRKVRDRNGCRYQHHGVATMGDEICRPRVFHSREVSFQQIGQSEPSLLSIMYDLVGVGVRS